MGASLSRLKALPWRAISRWGGAAALVLVVLHALIFGERGYLKARAVRAREQAIQREVEELRQRITALEKERKSLENGGRALEKTAREDYLYHRPGEVIILVEPPAQDGSPAAVDKKSPTL